MTSKNRIYKLACIMIVSVSGVVFASQQAAGAGAAQAADRAARKQERVNSAFTNLDAVRYMYQYRDDDFFDDDFFGKLVNTKELKLFFTYEKAMKQLYKAYLAKIKETNNPNLMNFLIHEYIEKRSNAQHDIMQTIKKMRLNS